MFCGEVLLSRFSGVARRPCSFICLRTSGRCQRSRCCLPPRCGCSGAGVARPCATAVWALCAPLPWARSSILPAIDVSLSRRVTDVKPSRIAAAQEAAKLFLRELPKHIEVVIITFAGSSTVAQRSTLHHASVEASIDSFQMQLGTAIGDAIVVSLAELFPDEGIDLTEMTFGSRPKGRSLDDKAKRRPNRSRPWRRGRTVLQQPSC